MAYVCIDGPLQGHVHMTESERPVGTTLSIDLVGIDRVTHDDGQIAEAHYEVESAPQGPVPGVVRYVSVRGMFRKPALPASFSELTTA